MQINSKTPLHFAVSTGLYKVVECLVNNGADVNASDFQIIL